MSWRRWGLKDNPYTFNEINETTLDLFVGRTNEIKCLQNAFFAGNKRVVFLEGDDGVGKTSIGNFWRYSSMQKRICFTPYAEILVDSTFRFFPFIAKVLEVLNWSIPQSHPYIARDPEFKAHENKSKELFDLVAGTKSLAQPVTDSEDQYLHGQIKELFKNIGQIVSRLNYEHGTLIQISFAEFILDDPQKNFLDFKKKLWELLGMDSFRWLLIGQPMLEEVLYHPDSGIFPDSLFKIPIRTLDLPLVHELLLRRKEYLGLSQNATLPLAYDVIDYIYLLSDGNLKKLFSICEKITELSSSYQTTLDTNLTQVKPLIVKFFQDKIRQILQVTPAGIEILNFLVKEEGGTPGKIAERTKRLRPNISRNLMRLKGMNLVRMEVKGRNRVYYPSMEAKIAFS